MDYERKYKEALERMKSWANSEHPECFSEAQKTAEFIFPELKESEDKDEMIRQCLIEHIKCNKDLNWSLFQWFKPDTIIAWLEKQGEKSTIIDIDKMVMEYSQTKDDDFGLPVNCMLRAYRKGINDALSITLFKKDFGL